MTTATIIIKDAKSPDGFDSIEIEGHLDPANAIDMPPTPAVVIGSYLAGNMERVSKDAMAWFQALTVATQPLHVEEPEPIRAPKIILPGDRDIDGVPV